MYTYKYNFRNDGVISSHKNILAYILCISIVDHRYVTVDELIYLASEFAGDGDIGPNSGYQKYLDSLMRTWNALHMVDPARLIAGGHANTNQPDYPTTLLAGAPTSTTLPVREARALVAPPAA